MLQNYISGKTDDAIYSAYLSDYNYAFSHKEPLEAVTSHAQYIDKCKAETGIDAWFVYDSGWLRLIGTDADILLLAALLVIFAGVFADEYGSRSSSGGFANILRPTKRGRRQTFCAKLVSAVISAAVMTALFSTADVVVICNRFSMPAQSAPVQSLELFGGLASELSIIEYVALMYDILVCRRDTWRCLSAVCQVCLGAILRL